MYYNGTPVTTTNHIAQIYQCSSGELLKHLLLNIEKFYGKFYVLRGEELRKFLEIYSHANNNDSYLVLWTTDALYLHAQLLDTEDAWIAYSMFVYFHFKRSHEFQKAIDNIAKTFEQVPETPEEEANDK